MAFPFTTITPAVMTSVSRVAIIAVGVKQPSLDEFIVYSQELLT